MNADRLAELPTLRQGRRYTFRGQVQPVWAKPPGGSGLGLPGQPGCGRLRVTDNGCRQKQQMFKNLCLMKTGSTHFLAVFSQQEIG